MDFLSTMDEASAALIIQLQIEDSHELSTEFEGKGKAREGDLTDIQFALELYKETLEETASIINDRLMTKSIARACQEDGNIVAASLSEEQTAAGDRETACRLGGIAYPSTVEPWTITAEQMDEELLAKLTALYVSEPTESILGRNYDYDGGSTAAGSSTWAASRAISSQNADRQCAACQERTKFYNVARVPCGHEYCRECLQDLYQASMTDDSLFPPRCCRQPITSGGVRLFLTAEIMRRYEQKKLEFDTPNRTYCSNPRWSAFIRTENIIDEKGTCPECRAITCTMCKAADHGGDCPADTGSQQLLETAHENGWQRCYSCHRVVDLVFGCNHITFV